MVGGESRESVTATGAGGEETHHFPTQVPRTTTGYTRAGDGGGVGLEEEEEKARRREGMDDTAKLPQHNARIVSVPPGIPSTAHNTTGTQARTPDTPQPPFPVHGAGGVTQNRKTTPAGVPATTPPPAPPTATSTRNIPTSPPPPPLMVGGHDKWGFATRSTPTSPPPLLERDRDNKRVSGAGAHSSLSILNWKRVAPPPIVPPATADLSLAKLSLGGEVCVCVPLSLSRSFSLSVCVCLCSLSAYLCVCACFFICVRMHSNIGT